MKETYCIKETSMCECAWNYISTAHTKVAEIRGNSPRVTGFNIVPLLLYRQYWDIRLTLA